MKDVRTRTEVNIKDKPTTKTPNKAVLEVGSCGTWNQELDFSRIVKQRMDSESSDELPDEVPLLESDDSN